MKNLILTFVIIFIIFFALVAKAQDSQYANLTPGYNYANNTVAANYAATGMLPAGYTTRTTQQICQKYGKDKMWVRYDVAAPRNAVINGGHYADPFEEFVFAPSGNILFAAKSGNYVEDVKFEGAPQSATNVYVQTKLVDTRLVENKVDRNYSDIQIIRNNQKVADDNVNYRFDNVDASISDIRNTLGTNHTTLEEIRQNTADGAKFALQSRNWAIAGTALAAVAATASSIDLLNGDGLAAVYNNSYTYNYTTNNIENPRVRPAGQQPTPGPSLNPSK
jgi:hypothetical protein